MGNARSFLHQRLKGVITQVDQAKDLGIIMDDACNIKHQRLEAVAKISCVVSFQGQRWGLLSPYGDILYNLTRTPALNFVC